MALPHFKEDCTHPIGAGISKQEGHFSRWRSGGDVSAITRPPIIPDVLHSQNCPFRQVCFKVPVDSYGGVSNLCEPHWGFYKQEMLVIATVKLTVDVSDLSELHVHKPSSQKSNSSTFT